ncbi:methylmalonyl-CoA epimerase [Flavihumibacter solisilvae]|nr:methylmalonyl-CoA epimerase [Flavihumibacter solisilvae]
MNEISEGENTIILYFRKSKQVCIWTVKLALTCCLPLALQQKMLKVEHIGIAVQSLAESLPLFEKLLNTPCYKIEEVESEQVRTAFFATGVNKIELLESTSPEGVIARYLAKRGEGIHHIAFEVQDIESEMKRLAGEGFELLQEKPKRGADNKLVCFLHPKGTKNVLVELCQEVEVNK